MAGVEGRRKIQQEVDPSIPRTKNVKRYEKVMEKVSECRIRGNEDFCDEKMEELMTSLLHIRRKN